MRQRQWIELKTIIEELNLDISIQGLTQKAKRANWERRRVEGAKGNVYEYRIADMPEEYQQALGFDASAVQLEQINDNDLVRLEVLDVQVSAGNGTMLDGELMPVTLAIEYAKSALGSGALPYLEKEHIKITNIRGDSMSPTIDSGDLLFVDISQPYFNGDGIYVFNYNGFNHVKRLQHAGDRLLVLSDNPQYRTWEIRLDNEGLFHVAGRVVFVSGKIRGV